jgi:hypothetical protein
MTQNCLEQVADSNDDSGLEWQKSEEEYPSIGKVNFQFALLENLKSNIPDPPLMEVQYNVDDRSTLETVINRPFKVVYLNVIDIMNRAHWVKGFTKIEAGEDHAYVGSLHTCVFQDYRAVITPLKRMINNEEVIYVEKMSVDVMDLEVIYEDRFRPTSSGGCQLDCRVMSASDTPLSSEAHYYLFEDLRKSCRNLKEYCEQGVGVGN